MDFIEDKVRYLGVDNKEKPDPREKTTQHMCSKCQSSPNFFNQYTDGG